MIDGMLASLLFVMACSVALWLRSYWIEHGLSWRWFLTESGLVFVAIGQRLLDRAARPSTPTGPKLLIRIRRTWERQTPMVIEREGQHVVVRVPGRVVKLRRVH